MVSGPVLPRYPIYIPSKGRAGYSLTARALAADGVPFKVVVEPQEEDAYAEVVGRENLLLLPQSGRGLIFARNWIKDHACESGAERHWQLDDNIKRFYRRYRGRRILCLAGLALRVCEDFTDRYENIAISGLNYGMFAPDGEKVAPFFLNAHVYSCTLVLNSTPHRWRLRYNDDTDMCLQVLADGWCTVLLNAFLADKLRTMVIGGGNTTDLYQGDGRLRMARSLQRVWPGVVTTGRRFRRPQHIVKDSWKRFDTPLRLKPGIDLASLSEDEYGMRLMERRPVRSPILRKLVEERREDGA